MEEESPTTSKAKVVKHSKRNTRKNDGISSSNSQKTNSRNNSKNSSKSKKKSVSSDIELESNDLYNLLNEGNEDAIVKAENDDNTMYLNCVNTIEDDEAGFSDDSEKETGKENDETSLMEMCYDDYIEELEIWESVIGPQADEESALNTFLSKDCCKRKCNSKFEPEELLLYRVKLRAIDYNEHGINQLDLVILGLIHSLCRVSDEIRHSRLIIKEKRRRLKMMFAFRGVSVCRAMFLFAHAIKIERLKRLLKRYKLQGLAPKPHGNYKRVPANAISNDQVNEVISFLKNYAKENGTVIPGRIPFQNADVKLLPPAETKLHVYKKFKEACGSKNVISVVSFRRLWNKFCPDVVIQRSDSLRSGQKIQITYELKETSE